MALYDDPHGDEESLADVIQLQAALRRLRAAASTLAATHLLLSVVTSCSLSVSRSCIRSAFFLRLLLVPSGSETRVRSAGTSESRRAICFTSWVSAALLSPTPHRTAGRRFGIGLTRRVKLQATWSIGLKISSKPQGRCCVGPSTPVSDESESGHGTCGDARVNCLARFEPSRRGR